MARAAKKAPPGVGHNSGLPDHGDIRTAAAMEMIFEEKEKALRDEKKRARSRLVEGKGLLQDDMKFLKDLRDKAPSDVIDLFKRRWHSVGAFFPEAHEQMDLFVLKSDAPTRAAHFTMGLVTGLQGKEFTPPPMVAGDDLQQMTKGYNEGRDRRQAASASLLAEAMDKKPGEVADGTPGAVGARAAADFAKDHGDDPLVVAGERYKTMRQANAARTRLAAQAQALDEGKLVRTAAGTIEIGSGDPIWADFPADNADWTDEQKDAFCTWFDALDDKTVIGIGVEYPGACAEFRRLRDALTPPFATGGTVTKLAASDDGGPEAVLPLTEGETGKLAVRPSVSRPDFHAWSEDWLQWNGAQQMEFRRWYESLPEGVIPPITHQGAVDYFNELRQETENRRLAGESEKPGPQVAETPDPEVVAAGAKKLADSGFVPPKKTRSRAKAPV